MSNDKEIVEEAVKEKDVGATITFMNGDNEYEYPPQNMRVIKIESLEEFKKKPHLQIPLEKVMELRKKRAGAKREEITPKNIESQTPMKGRNRGKHQRSAMPKKDERSAGEEYSS